MKYYSEVLKKAYDTEKECIKAERDYEAKLAEAEKQKKELADARKARAKEVEDAYKVIVDAQKHYNELKSKFIKDYGSWHMTFSTNEDGFNWNFFDDFIKIF